MTTAGSNIRRPAHHRTLIFLLLLALFNEFPRCASFERTASRTTTKQTNNKADIKAPRGRHNTIIDGIYTDSIAANEDSAKSRRTILPTRPYEHNTQETQRSQTTSKSQTQKSRTSQLISPLSSLKDLRPAGAESAHFSLITVTSHPIAELIDQSTIMTASPGEQDAIGRIATGRRTRIKASIIKRRRRRRDSHATMPPENLDVDATAEVLPQDNRTNRTRRNSSDAAFPAHPTSVPPRNAERAGNFSPTGQPLNKDPANPSGSHTNPTEFGTQQGVTTLPTTIQMRNLTKKSSLERTTLRTTLKPASRTTLHMTIPSLEVATMSTRTSRASFPTKPSVILTPTPARTTRTTPRITTPTMGMTMQLNTLHHLERITIPPTIDPKLLTTLESLTSRPRAAEENQLGFPWPVKKEAVMEGDIVLGGLMMVHEREDSITCGPVMPQGGIQALEAMLYTLDKLNDPVQGQLLPNITLGAHILDDCDKDTYGLEMAVDFIKG